MAQALNIAFDRYHTHDELTRALQEMVAQYPEFARLRAIGRSHQSREVWAVELSNWATGEDDQKPGYYIDGNCHGQEVITSEVALYTVWHVLTHYGQDPLVTNVLDTRALYILPRINPDGAEWSLTTPYRHVGNGHYPFWEEPHTGHRTKDLDGDGRVVDMRVVDPAGEWKVSTKDPRLMILREPGEVGGVYYRVYPEGEILDYDGVNVPMGKARHGNLNRQYPSHWGPEAVEYGAGQLPLNEPEARAIAEYVLAHPNITGAVAYHSHGGVILRQSSARPDRDLPAGDVRLFKAIGAVGTQLTGYPVISTFHDFTAEMHNIRHGGFTDWMYECLGVVPYAVELWDVERAAGLEKVQFFQERARTEEEQLQLIDWADRNCDGQAFVSWHPFHHPQLGDVEIGGWDHQFMFRNPPAKFIAQVALPNAQFTLRHAACSPRLRVVDAGARSIGPGLYLVQMVIGNEGYLPTNLTDQADRLKIVPDVKARLEYGPEVELVLGPAEQELGQLAGYSERRDPWNAWGPPWRPVQARAQWEVRVAAGHTAALHMTASALKAGTVTCNLSLQG